jgi:hypothetical protein
MEWEEDMVILMDQVMAQEDTVQVIVVLIVAWGWEAMEEVMEGGWEVATAHMGPMVV